MTQDALALPHVSYEDAQKETRSGEFLSALYLLHGQSKAVQESKGVVGEFFCDDSPYGKSVDIVVLDMRYHATYTENNFKKMESFRHDSQITADIKAIKRNVAAGVDNRYGWSWLLYLPDMKKIVVFHPNTPSARIVSATLLKCITPPGKRSPQDQRAPFTRAFTLASEMVVKANQKYPVPVATPIQMDKNLVEQMDKEQVEKAIEMFRAPVLAEKPMQASNVER